ncbi:MAG: alpha/beta fold hydrolase [Roseobacter sp.]
MSLSPAPFFQKVSYGPEGGAAYWTQTSDDVRVRVGHWPLAGAKGTVLIFPGRTEFIEKYGQIAGSFAARGLASMAIDWRGQGLADRLLENPLIGHVEQFSDYQKDVAAMVRAARELNAPRPFYLLAHSMGGAIGLRAAIEGLAVQSVVFSGPMWGIKLAPHMRPMAWILSHMLPQVGHGHRLPPGTKLEHHVLVDGFKNNLLTRDQQQFDIMKEQLTTHPELALGGPSFVWLREALKETRHLSSRPAPNLPCLTFLGSNERIVDIPAIQSRMSSWKKGSLEIVPDGEHEVLMESPQATGPLFDQMSDFYLRGTDG